MPKKSASKCDCEGHAHKCSCGGHDCDCDHEPDYQAEEIAAEDGKTFRSVKLGAPKHPSSSPELSQMDETTKTLMRAMGFNV